MIMSGRPRLVVRGSLKHISAQIIEAYPEGDRTLVASTSNELKRYGWKAPCGNIPAAYLTGFLLGSKAKANRIASAILDMGLRRSSKGSRIYAVLKGVLDAEVEIPHDEAILPEDTRIKGVHIAAYAETLAQTEVEVYEHRFSTYLAAGITPEKLPGYFQQVKTNVTERLKAGN